MQDWTIQKLLNWITSYFTEKEVDSPRLSAELLLSFILDLQRIELYTNFERSVAKEDLDKLHKLVKRCGEHEPLAYIIGRTEFYSLTIKVSRACLIPRPETELLVEKSIEFLRLRRGPRLVCDLCTGSGCIATAIAKNLADARIIATDICEQAVSVAAENAATHRLKDRITFSCGDLFEAIATCGDTGKFDLIVCNPPYVKTAEYAELDKNVRDYEPGSAFLAGEDGLDIYRRIIESVDGFLKPDGALILETGFTQGKAVKELLEQRNCFAEIKVEKDHGNNDRMVTAYKKQP